jgi:hypothetical protein
MTQPILSTEQREQFLKIWIPLIEILDSSSEGITVKDLAGIIAQVKDALSKLQALKVEANSNL